MVMDSSTLKGCQTCYESIFLTVRQQLHHHAASLTMMQILTVVELCSLICMVLQSDKLELQDLSMHSYNFTGI